MKKVIALALAVLMMATVAYAAQVVPDTYPGNTLTIDRDEVDAGNVLIRLTTEGGLTFSVNGDDENESIEKFIPRSVNTTNYSVTNVKFKLGKGLIESISINDTDDCVEIAMKDDLTNTKAQSFEASFKLKGKAKYTLTDSDYDNYIAMQTTKDSDLTTKGGNAQTSYNQGKPTKVSLPNLDFDISGTVGYGLVNVSLGNDNDEEFESLVAIARQLGTTWDGYDVGGVNDDGILRRNIFKFTRNTTTAAGDVLTSSSVPMAGAYTADAILTQEYGDALTMEARVYHNDKLYFGLTYTPDKKIVNRLADADGDLDFYTFGSNKDYVTFNSNCTLYFNDADEDCFVYKVNDNGYLVPTGEYSEDDGCWIVKTRTLGRYVVTDVELSDDVQVSDGDPTTANPDTGANDVVGIAAALAAVALVSAAAVSLKK